MTRIGRVLARWETPVVVAVGLACAVVAATPAASAASPGGARAARTVAGHPSRAAIARVMARTVEVGDAGEHFVPLGKPVSTGSGSKALTAEIGQRSPTADGYGQLVFFWAGTTFLGWDSLYESVSILRLSGNGDHAVKVTYAHYAANDPAYDPSLPPVAISYRWRDGRLSASATPPSLSYLDLKVRLRRPNSTGVTIRLTGPQAAKSGALIALKVKIMDSLKYGGGQPLAVILQNRDGRLRRIASKTVSWSLGGSLGVATVWVRVHAAAMGPAVYRAAWTNPGGTTNSNVLRVAIK